MAMTADGVASEPPWHAMSVREVAEALGVSIQVLANWRIRGRGPRPLPAEVFRGNRTFYPAHEVANALSKEPSEGWLQCRAFLLQHGLVRPDAGYDNLIDVLKLYDAGELWPHRHRPKKCLVELIPPPTRAEADSLLPSG
jgi:hypothetical protein